MAERKFGNAWRHGEGWLLDGIDGPFPVTSLVGEVVNIGTKDGLVYESATVLEVTDDGSLTLTGGQYGSPYWEGREPVPLDREQPVWLYDVARGYVHEPQAARHA
jgi:hypothetical protein